MIYRETPSDRADALDSMDCDCAVSVSKNENAATRLPQRLAKIIPKNIIAKIPFGSRENFSTAVSLRLSMSQ
jgi:hypothetical protein